MMRRLIAAAALAFAVACSSDSPVAPISTNVDGSYSLSTVNGSKVPYVLAADGSYRQELSSGALILSVDSSYIARSTTTDYITGVTPQAYPDSSSGKWTRSGNTVTLTNSFDQSVVTATFTGSTLVVTQTMLGAAATLIYSR